MSKKRESKRDSKVISVGLPSEDGLMNGTVERIYGLDDHRVPPARYADFLIDSRNAFEKFFLRHNQVRTYDALRKKTLRTLRKYNPESSDKDLESFISKNPFRALLDARLIHGTSIVPKRRLGVANRSNKYVMHLLTKDYMDGFIPFSKHKSEISKRLSAVRKALDKKIPNRRGKVVCWGGAPWKKKKNGLPELRGFRIHFDLESHNPLSHLETEIVLRDYGIMSDSKKGVWVQIPAISVRSRVLYGGTEIPEKFANEMEKVVRKYYTPVSTEFRQSVVDEPRFRNQKRKKYSKK